jgi:alpha-L-arabinofuranosidase
MSNIAQMVNVLQAVILTDREKMVLTPTYHVFEMYKVHQGATLIPLDLKTPEYEFGGKSIPAVSASASRDSDGRVHLSLVALDPNQPIEFVVKMKAKSISGRIITAEAMNAHNTFDSPDAVTPVAFTDFVSKADQLAISLPAKSVLMLEIQ